MMEGIRKGAIYHVLLIEHTHDDDVENVYL